MNKPKTALAILLLCSVLALAMLLLVPTTAVMTMNDFWHAFWYSYFPALLLGLPLAALTVWWWMQQRALLRERQALRTAREHLQQALWGSGDGLWDWNLQTAVVQRYGIAEMLGLSPDAFEGSTSALFDRMHEQDRYGFLRAIGQHLSGRSESFDVEYRLRHQDGSWCWVQDRGRLLRKSEAGAPLRIAGTTKHISNRKRIEDELKIAATVFDHMNECVLITDLQQSIVRVNRAFLAVFGYEAGDIIGSDIKHLQSRQHNDDDSAIWRVKLLHTDFWHGERWQRRLDGSEVLMSCDWKVVRNQAGVATHCVGVLTNITDRKRAENELRYLATHDPLTALPNRSHFHDRLTASIKMAAISGNRLAVLFIDVDHFKNVNDSLGHAYGDLLLQQIATRLRQIIDEGDVVARLGGDEFTVLLHRDVSSTRAAYMANKILEVFRAPFLLQETEVGLSPSLGISIFPEHGRDATTLLRGADIALYRSKAMGRATFQIFANDMQQHSDRRLHVESALRRALERNELELNFQPRMNALTGRIASYEALVRWRSGTLGAVSPDEFIAVAEDAGLINAIGDWVLITACVRAAQWAQQGSPVRVAVNLSARQLLQSRLAQRVHNILLASNLSPDLLEIEITESVLIGSHELVLQNMAQLRRLGVRLALDDFGTGYATFAYLKRYSFDTIKIAREFVQDIGKQPSAGAIAAAIIELAHNLDMKVVAEGVENRTQFEFLRQMGCEEVQGFWIGKPNLEPTHIVMQLEHALN